MAAIPGLRRETWGTRCWRTARSLGGDDAAEGVTARENNASVIDLGRRDSGNLRFGQGGALSQGSAAGRAPIGFLVNCEDGVAMGADALHEPRLLEAHRVT